MCFLHATFAVFILGFFTHRVCASDDRILSGEDAELTGRLADREKRTDVDLRLVFVVGATRIEKNGQFKDWVLLNSSDTFGSCHSLQIAIPPQVLKELKAVGLWDPAAQLKGKRLQLRARVACVDEPREDGKGTYRQVRLKLLNSGDLKVLTNQ